MKYLSAAAVLVILIGPAVAKDHKYPSLSYRRQIMLQWVQIRPECLHRISPYVYRAVCLKRE